MDQSKKISIIQSSISFQEPIYKAFKDKIAKDEDGEVTINTVINRLLQLYVADRIVLK